MPDHLVSIADAQGRLRLATSEDGKRLLTSTDCDLCCAPGPGGNCLTLRRYDRCPLTPEQLRCVNGPDHIWICDLGGCAPSESLLGGKLRKYRNACYHCTDVTRCGGHEFGQRVQPRHLWRRY